MLSFIQKHKYIVITLILILVLILVFVSHISSEYNKFSNKTKQDVATEFIIIQTYIESKVKEYYDNNQEYPISYNTLVDFKKLKIKEPKTFENEGYWIIDKLNNKVKFKLTKNSVLEAFEFKYLLHDYIE